MLTRKSAELTLFDIEFSRERFRLTLDGSKVTLRLNPAARNRLEWLCDTCEVPCEHVGAAFSLILEEKLALGHFTGRPAVGHNLG